MTTNSRIGTAESAFATFEPYCSDDPDYAGIRSVLQHSVPFNNHAGLRIAEVGPERGVVEVPDSAHLLNAAGTAHAGALFLAADMAGSAAFLGALAPALPRIEMFLLRDCRITFLKPALLPVTVVAKVDGDVVATALEARSGRFDLDAKAQIRDASGKLLAKAYLDFVFSFVP